MYCYECASDPCKFFPDWARTEEGYRRFMRLKREEEVSASEMLQLFEHALLLYLDSTELEDERENEE